MNQSNQLSSESEDDTEPEDSPNKLLWAAYKGDQTLVKQLLNEDPSIVNFCDSEGYTAIHRASSEGYVDVVETLVTFKANIHAQTIDGWTPLHCACKWNNADVAQQLLDNGADINARSNGNVTPLHAAASERKTRDVLVLLLNNPKLDPSLKNDSGDTAYDLAKRYSSNSGLFQLVMPHISLS